MRNHQLDNIKKTVFDIITINGKPTLNPSLLQVMLYKIKHKNDLGKMPRKLKKRCYGTRSSRRRFKQKMFNALFAGTVVTQANPYREVKVSN